MRTVNVLARRTYFALAVVLALGVAPSADARRIFIDFGDGNFDTTGNSFPVSGSATVDLTNNGFVELSLGFDVNVGGAALTFGSLFLHENGAVTLGSSDLATATNVINVFRTELTSAVPGLEGPPTLNVGEIFHSTGQADPDVEADGVYDLAALTDAFRATWYGPTDSGANAIFAQLYFYDQGAGNFDLRLAYGDDGFGGVPTLGTALAGFALGANTTSITGSLDQDFFYRFNGGVLGGSPVAVAEPSTSVLFAIGLVGLLGFRNRRIRPTFAL